MASSRKIKVVIEVELVDDDNAPANYTIVSDLSAAELEVSKQHEQAMLAALRADPASYAEFVKNIVIGSIEASGVNREISELARVRDYYTASVAVLQNLIPKLPAEAQQYYQQATREGWLADGTDLVFDTIKATPLTLTVEYPVEQG
ncbi:hypothetical protein [Hymenobacter lucidus]|uniref:Uncharacterized protein n=1 Tax=Hymenobacter lucidus TaxID=2880930 RepID=A0ABS8AY58_9BACT|nr:hypothetical protein [Hymenobacter lucidus]MCB2410754.1 hypothetical protein [Hymenobacter lucidus]